MEPIEPQSLLQNATSAKVERHLSECMALLSKWAKLWIEVFPNSRISEKTVMVYAASLKDLSIEQLERGCREASKEMEQFPKPGTIRRAAFKSVQSDTAGLGAESKRRHRCAKAGCDGWERYPNGEGGYFVRPCRGQE